MQPLDAGGRVVDRPLEQHELTVPLSAGERAVNRFRLHFVSPTELKHQGRVVHEPRFDVLFARARDRVSSLMSFYQGGAPDLAFRELAEIAAKVRLAAAEGRKESFRRISSRGFEHSLSGFVGEAEYEGDASELFPILRAAWWTGRRRASFRW